MKIKRIYLFCGIERNKMIKFGWAETDITPKEKISLAGEFFERVTNEVETPLTVTALAIEANGEQSIFCSCDVVAISHELTEAVRDRLKNKDIKRESIVITCIHCHNSYVYRRKGPYPKVVTDALQIIRDNMIEGCEYVPQEESTECIQPDEAFEILADAIAATIDKAWENRSVGGYATGFGRAAIGMQRRVCYSDGTAKMWGDVDTATFTELEAGNDSGIEMLFVYDENDKMTGVAINVACPAQVMEQRSIISSDYFGKVKILLREKYGKDMMLLPICSAAGDQCPRDLIRWVQPETPIKDPNVIRTNPKRRDADPSMFDIKGTWKIGRRIMNEIDMALEEVTEIIKDAEHRHESRRMALPLRRVTDKEKTESENKIRDFFKGKTVVDYMDSAELYVHTGTIQRHKTQELYSTYNIEIHAIRLGSIAFVTNPFELFLYYGDQIRARSCATQTFIAQLSNGDGGYLPTEKAEKAGHYSAYVSSGYVDHTAGDLLVSATLDMINGIFDGE